MRAVLERRQNKMETSHVVFNLRDNGGRRLGVDRRRFSYADHFPERRLGEERRSGQDRRGKAERRTESDRRSGNHLDSLGDRQGRVDNRSAVDRREFMIL
jgi:hypothetical protein